MDCIYQNYTPHAIFVADERDEQHHFPSLGVARVNERQESRGTAGGFALRHTTYGTIQGLPVPRDGVLCIVSLVVLQANAQLQEPRQDLVAPDTGISCVRHDHGPQKGQIKFVTGFCV